MVPRFSTDAMKNVVSDTEIDGAERSLKKVWNLGMLSKVNVLLNDVRDVHLELEDDDHDVTHAVDHDVSHAVSTPLSFKVGMMERMC